MGPLVIPVLATAAIAYGWYRNRKMNTAAGGNVGPMFPPVTPGGGGGGARPMPVPVPAPAANPRGVVAGSIVTVDPQAVSLEDLASAAGGAAGAATVAAVILRADQVSATSVSGPWLGFRLTNGAYQRSNGPRQTVAINAIGNVYPPGTDLFA